jgi:hypothetical protein
MVYSEAVLQPEASIFFPGENKLTVFAAARPDKIFALTRKRTVCNTKHSLQECLFSIIWNTKAFTVNAHIDHRISAAK